MKLLKRLCSLFGRKRSLMPPPQRPMRFAVEQMVPVTLRIQLRMPYGSAATMDTIQRMMADQMAEHLAQYVTVSRVGPDPDHLVGTLEGRIRILPYGKDQMGDALKRGN